MSAAGARDQLSFNLAGPFALAVSVWFFGALRLTEAQRSRVLLSLAAPAVAVAAVAALRINHVTAIDFTTESNFATSGGFMPNQVSAALGLGAAAAGLLALGVAGGSSALHGRPQLSRRRQMRSTSARRIVMAAAPRRSACCPPCAIRDHRRIDNGAAAAVLQRRRPPRLERMTGGMLGTLRDTGTRGRPRRG